MDTVTAAALDMKDSLEDEDDIGVPPANAGGEEIVIPAPGPISIYTQEADEDVIEHLVIGWNSSGSPIIVGSDGGLTMLGDGERVRDLTW
jgi:hypothetical protein